MSNEKLIAAEPEEVVLTVPFPLQIDGTVMDANGRVRLDISTKNIFVILADEQGTEIACMTEILQRPSGTWGSPMSSAALHPIMKDSHPGMASRDLTRSLSTPIFV
jgi:hypothetical protein